MPIDCAFNYCSGLTSITIPDSVSSIGYDAFADCYKLVEVINNSSLNITKGSSDNGYVAYYAINVKKGGSSDIVNQNGYMFYACEGVNYLLNYIGAETEPVLPENYKGQNYKIYSYALYNCSGLTSITIGSCVTSIGEGAFSGCSGLTSIIIPDGVISIGYDAFSDCSGLTSVTIGNGVTSIGLSAFYNCSGLENIYITDIAAWCNISGLNGLMCNGSSNKKLYLNNELVTDLVIPDGVTSIGYNAFRGCSGLTSIIIPDGVISIGYDAFSDCSGLTSVIWNAENCTKAGSSNYPVFKNCNNLKQVTIGENVKTIPSYAFYGCSGLTSITIPDSVTSIGSSAFRGCKNLKYNEYKNALYLGNSDNPYVALVKAKTTSITSCEINNKTKIICGSAFYNCNGLKSIIIPDSVTSIDSYAFVNCSGLTSVTIGKGVTSIGEGAFSGCSGITSITIPDSVTSIGWSAFEDCSGLTSVTIGNGVVSIASYAFDGCSSLETVYYAGTSEQWDNIYMDGSNSYLTSATRYYYSETEPELTEDGTAYNGNYWHYDEDGVTPVIWKKALKNG